MRLSHRLMCPCRQNSHFPHDTVESNVTRSPTLNRSTALPIRSMTPAASCPITSGGMRLPVEPSYPWVSLPQMPQALPRTGTSSAAISGGGMATTFNFLYAEGKSAFIVDVGSVFGLMGYSVNLIVH